MTFKPYPIMTVGVLAALAVLLWLGDWQWDKFRSGLEQEAAPPPSYETVTVLVEAERGGVARQVYGLIDSEAVWRRYVPGRVDGIGEPVLTLWDATSGPEPVELPLFGLGAIERPSAVFVRPVKRGAFTAPDDIENNRWYTFDGAALIETYGYDADPETRVVEPAEVTVRMMDDLSRKRIAINPYVTIERIDTLPPQRHLGYALSWWGLAAALVGVYLAFHGAKGRLRFGSAS
ncbi:MAG: SURF1 family cytochrome oxidase biogenesis protein [Pseudomonadota bacterium]